MPTIVQSSAFAQRGIALNESSCVEQVNGLVEVQTRFTIAKSRQQEIDRLFHVDAPPPIDPACIAKSSLLTNRLYMQSRTVSSSTGFLTIDASYVGGLARQGFRGFYLTEDKGPTQVGFSLNGQFFKPDGSVSFQVGPNKFYRFNYFSTEKTIEFVQIGNITGTAIPQFNFFDLFVLEQVTLASGFGTSINDGIDVIFSQNARFPQLVGEQASRINRTQEPATFMTPSVKVAKIRYSI